MTNEEREVIERLRGAENRLLHEPPSDAHQLSTIHYTALPEDLSQGPAAAAWNLYRREVGRLLAQGQIERVAEG
jgi:hypothetical protein